MKTEHTYLKPWIGGNYNIGFNGHRVLVLGASHYASAEDWNEDFTIHVIKDCYLNPEDPFDYWKRTYTKFERAMAGYEVAVDERPELWSKFMFWNFIQEPMSGPNKSAPSDDAIYTGQKAFLELIEIYKPDRVIVWGKTLYGWLPDKGKQGDIVRLPQAWKDGKVYDTETWEYTLADGSVCIVMPLADHPARGFAWDYYHLFIKEFLK